MMTNNIEVPAPGEIIRDELEARGWTQRDLAYVLGVPEQAVNLIAAGKRGISADMAKALADAFGVPAEFFMNLQRAYDLSRAEQPDPGVARKARLQSCYPVREMIKRGWLADSSADALETQMARFFGVPTIDDVPHLAYAAKKTHYDKFPPSQLAWLFRVKQIAGRLIVPKYSEKSLREALPVLRTLMTDPTDVRRVPRILNDCGIRFVLVERLPGAKIDGVCFWLDRNSPVVGMSLRFDRIDNFWFVLGHELEHVLRRHGVTDEMVDAEIEGEEANDKDLPEDEKIANAAATNFCIPKAKMDSWIARKNPFFSEVDLLGFARTQNVHPGIVAGQLRNRLKKYQLFAKHLVKIRQSIVMSAVVDGWGQVYPVN